MCSSDLFPSHDRGGKSGGIQEKLKQIDEKLIIDNRWVIESLNENVLSWDNKGNMLVVDVEVALKEYPESGDKNGV